MVDTAAIVVAVLALLGTIIQAVIGGWIGYHSEERKQQDQHRQTVAKYRYPLSRAAEDLSHKLLNIVSHNFASLYASEDSPERQRSYATLHTSYVIGQFFSWAQILYQETQFLTPPHGDFDSRETNRILKEIRMTLLTDTGSSPFMLWSGEQRAISEIMIVRDPQEDGGQARCMGYATFCQQWKADEQFRAWFAPVEEGLAVLSANPKNADMERLQSLQHLLVDLLQHLAHYHLLTTDKVSRCRVAPVWCRCRQCKVKPKLGL
ncbi:hypothetical protein E1B28_013320 [Marasmius oreades]|uniref:Uncharacterized protein n=1 Tax=Marasmius oreades TaxID=181124 RepID=A0A9P7RPC0_9AGAR|nr:uncharacterized protein E1B28_013320 [Marasmius oreades]KAG7087344.1 hypothetical protein E1B28_013320 [Marasmius oreades]